MPREEVRRTTVTYAAKKKGGKKGGGNKKGPKPLVIPTVEATPAVVDPTARTDVIMHSLQLIDSHYKATTQPLLEGLDISVAATALYEAPFVLISTTLEDPMTIDYANKMALRTFGYTWSEMTELPVLSLIHESQQEVLLDAWRKTVEGSTPWEGLHLTKDTVEVPIDGGLAWAVKSSSGNVIGVAMKWTPPPPAEEEESGGAPADVAAVPGQQPQEQKMSEE